MSARWTSEPAIPSRSMPDKNFQIAPCGNGRTKRTKRTERGLNATPVNATLGVDRLLPFTRFSAMRRAVTKLLLSHQDHPHRSTLCGRPAVEQSSRHIGVAGGPEVPEVFAAGSP